MQRGEFAESDVAADRLRIFAGVRPLGLEARAVGIRKSAPGQIGLEDVAARRDDRPFQSVDRNPVAWIEDRPGCVGYESRIHIGEERHGVWLALYRRTGVVIRPDRDIRGQFGHAAEVIAMPVRGNEVVDLRQTGILGSFENSPGIAHGVGTAVTGIDEHGFPGGAYKQGRVAAFNIDDVDLK